MRTRSLVEIAKGSLFIPVVEGVGLFALLLVVVGVVELLIHTTQANRNVNRNKLKPLTFPG